MNNVLILNLLIAILTNTQAGLEANKLVLYVREILNIRNKMEYNKRYSALVSSFSPWNGVLIPVLPIFLLARDSRSINSLMLHVEYIPIVYALTLVFLIGNLLLMPFAYLHALFLKTTIALKDWKLNRAC